MVRFITFSLMLFIFGAPLYAQDNLSKPVSWYLGTWETEHESRAGKTIFIEPGKTESILQASFHKPCGEDRCLIGRSEAYPQFDSEEKNAYELMGRFRTGEQKTQIKFFLQPDKDGNLKALMYIARGELAQEVEAIYKRTKPFDPNLVKGKEIRESVGNLGVIKGSIQKEKLNQPGLDLPISPAQISGGKIYGTAQGLTHLASQYTVYIQRSEGGKSWFVDPKANGYYELGGLKDGLYLVSVLIRQGYEDIYQITPTAIDYKIHIQNGKSIQYNWQIKKRIADQYDTQITGKLESTSKPRIYQVLFKHKKSGKYFPAKFNESGFYSLKNIPPGEYKVSLEFAGKADGIVQAVPYPENIQLIEGQIKSLNFKLK